MFFGGSGKLKIETAEDLIKALKGEPGEPGGQGNSIESIGKDGDDLVFKLTYGQEVRITDVKGLKGDKGDKGDKGAKGDKGDPGLNGLDGKDGLDGINGLDGKDGIDGEDGLDGLKGDKGDKGDPGLNGLDGKDGIDGEDGLDGKDGIDGEDGLDGKDGKDGLDAKFSKWVKHEDVEVETESESANLAVFKAESDKLYTIKAFVEAKAEAINGWFVGEKAFVINAEKQSINAFNIIPDQKTHEQFNFEIKLVSGKPTLAVKSLATKVAWKAKVEIYDL